MTTAHPVFDRIAAWLTERLHGPVSAETARRLVVDSYDRLRTHARVDTHLVTDLLADLDQQGTR
ncbi:hypothetical protein [Actinomadura rayongensis]|uniref:Protein-tyrosine-phosphatase-like N-terminal domain-containing protein n=1 Tax=Actinomadura rayongensis TaxID=1429076 RepID=A0A6I4W8G1_9ACTN|nr:hypothetical protein [Actinomadura rayongensis]MXQ65060.1 hypothetical protein [Actinomadura rayongensis]